MYDELMTRKDVAEYLKVSLRTVDNLIHRKDFTGIIRIGRSIRIKKSKLNNYLNKMTI